MQCTVIVTVHDLRGRAPSPIEALHKRGQPYFPFDVLDVGDSFLVDHCPQGGVNSACVQYRKRYGRLFHIRERNDEKEGWRIQCWRLE